MAHILIHCIETCVFFLNKFWEYDTLINAKIWCLGLDIPNSVANCVRKLNFGIKIIIIIKYIK